MERETIDGSELDFIPGAPKHSGQRELVLLHRSVGLTPAADRGDAAGPVEMAALILRGYIKRGMMAFGTTKPDVPGQPSLAGTVLQTLVA